jgi:hypothetical protein
MGVAVTGMHYTGMAAIHVHLNAVAVPVQGVGPMVFVVPTLLITTVTLVGLFSASLNLMSNRELRLATAVLTPEDALGSRSRPVSSVRRRDPHRVDPAAAVSEPVVTGVPIGPWPSAGDPRRTPRVAVPRSGRTSERARGVRHHE